VHGTHTAACPIIGKVMRHFYDHLKHVSLQVQVAAAEAQLQALL
jgi:hypothetical protein